MTIPNRPGKPNYAALPEGERLRAEIAHRILLYRTQRGISRGDLARLCFCAWGTIRNIEECYTFPSVPMLCRIARALSTTPDALLGFADAKP